MVLACTLYVMALGKACIGSNKDRRCRPTSNVWDMYPIPKWKNLEIGIVDSVYV